LRHLFLDGLVTSSVSNLGFLHWFQLPHMQYDIVDWMRI
jgi:hypothetical protein